MSKDIVIVNGARTAWAEYSGTPKHGAFKNTTAIDLGAVAAKGALEKSGVDAEWIDHTVIGNALQTSGDAIYGARHVALKAGVPIDRPALTINRLCGSGVEAVASAARMINAGEATWTLAGGMENMSQAPHVLRGARDGYRLGMQPVLEDLLMVSLLDPYCGCYMAQTANNCAEKWGVTREEQDEYAMRSHRLATAAVQNNLFAEEIVPVTVKIKRKEVEWTADDHIKPDTSIEQLSALPGAFGKESTVTAGNASGIVDGAACVVVTTAEAAKEKGVSPLGRIVGYTTVGVEPSLMGIGPSPAIKKLWEQTGIGDDQIALYEINEAFSGQYLACEKDLGLNRDKCNVNGGSVGLGHPLAATGTRLLLTVLLELKRRGEKYGVASACIGGGQGIAMLVEAL